MTSPRQGISELPHLCNAYGIDHAIISPGSRNAPLIMAFTGHPSFRCFSITDERSAAYYALGMAQQMQKPVVLICTSGTALANYAPALAEAYYLKIPLMVLSADRPPEWIDQNDGQTIRQNQLFTNITKQSFTLPVETATEEDLWLFRREICHAIGVASSGIPGPVHLNVPLREPLYDPLPPVKNTPPVIEQVSAKAILYNSVLTDLANQWEKFSRILIVCGLQHPNPILSESLQNIAKSHQAVLMAENLSNQHGSSFITTPDRYIASLSAQQMAALQPQLLVTLGGPVLSKGLKKFLRSHKPNQHWHIDEHDHYTDTFQSLSHNIRISPEEFFSKLADTTPHNKEYCTQALLANHNTQQRHEQFLTNAGFSDLTAYNMIFGNLPHQSIVHLANSTAVRYSQLFESHPDIAYFSNRGTSGIDGCLSTASGAAMVTNKLNIALVGDLAFVYDSNALWNNTLPPNLRIIVMDNQGGNIFKLIDTGNAIEPIRQYFETPHQVKMDLLCQAFGIHYMHAANTEELSEKLHLLFKPNDRPVVLHITTSGSTSALVYKQYYQHISQKK